MGTLVAECGRCVRRSIVVGLGFVRRVIAGTFGAPFFRIFASILHQRPSAPLILAPFSAGGNTA